MVLPKNYQETTDMHILLGVGNKNIFSGNIYEILFSKDIFKNLFVEEKSETIFSKFIMENILLNKVS